jgi:outer membrane protein assembly factor BamB
MHFGFRSLLPASEQQLAAMLEDPAGSDSIGGTAENAPEEGRTPEQVGGPDGGSGSPQPKTPSTAESAAPIAGDATPAPATPDPFGAESIDVKQTWPRFRGPGGLGVSTHANLPTTWNGETGEGIRWKTYVPLPGNSSPVVWGNRIFLTGATEQERVVFCVDADSGEIRWQTAVPSELDPATEPPEVGETTGFAACTPVTDGRHVYAMFANGDLAGVDYEGNVVWSRSLGVPDNIYGHASSLTMHEHLLIVLFDQGSKDDGKSRLLGIDGATGETVWETVREVPNSWTTPIVIEHQGQPQIITAADPWVIAYAPADGKELWRVECLQADVGPSPVYADGVVYSANEFPGVAALRVPAAAGGTEAEIIWEADIGAPDCASPLVTGEFVLLLASYGTLTCYDAESGVDPLWEEDFDDSSFTSSPTLAGTRVYLFGEEGLCYVVEPTAEACKRIAQSDLGEGCVTSPALQDGRIYVRGAEHLFCIESSATSAGSD